MAASERGAVRGEAGPRSFEVLTTDAVAFVTALRREFSKTREGLLERRRRRPPASPRMNGLPTCATRR